MTIRVALHHRTRYAFDRAVAVSPHEIRLRPAPHTRTPLAGYSLKIRPAKHFLNWQQDAYGNWIARAVFPDKTRELEISVDLIADMTVINPFDFFVEARAETFPFDYPAELREELAPYLRAEPPGPRLAAWLERFNSNGYTPGVNTVDFLVALNQRLQSEIAYTVRMEPGVQTPEQTIERAIGSCRDSGWLLVQILRNIGLASRFVSGYLIQLAPDQKPLDGPAGPARDFTDLHAWAEVFLPGAGWVGLDPTSGMLAGEGHIPLAATAIPSSAAPVTGFTDPCESTLDFEMTVTRIHEDPRVTKPYTDAQWAEIDALGRAVDRELAAGDVRLTMGGEPTFVSADDMEGEEWNSAALSPKKWELALALAHRLRARFAPGALFHFGQGKWYPGEPLPRWAIGLYWRRDGRPLWSNEALLAFGNKPGTATIGTARDFARALAAELGLPAGFVIDAYEDPLALLKTESTLPANIDPLRNDFRAPDERARLARVLSGGAGDPAGFVLPLRAAPQTEETTWQTSAWPLRRERLYLIPGDSPAGYRLPLDSLPAVPAEELDPDPAEDPFSPRGDLHASHVAAEHARRRKPKAVSEPKAPEVVRTALCLSVREGHLYVFLPPLTRLGHFVALTGTIESAAGKLGITLRLEGYEPPPDPRLRVLKVTPDPGVIEVNVHPSASWQELADTTVALYEDARQTRLGTEKFMLDGRHTGTGGGNHVTLGGRTAADSPLLRRPDLLASLITYWQNHPALSYLFSGLFIGPTSQSPRVDEARDDNLYELEIGLQQLAERLPALEESHQPWLVDRILRNFLVDLTGNTHRTEFSIDKLYSPDGPTGRLGLLELRAFEMPPHARMSLAQQLLIRALVAWFWEHPYRRPLVRWGTTLHDRFMLPRFIWADFESVIAELADAGLRLDAEWFVPHFEFRFPLWGAVERGGVTLELRQALEPWLVLGEQSGAGTVRTVDSSLDRAQVIVRGARPDQHVVACNGYPLPLAPTGTMGEAVAGVRFRAWPSVEGFHPTIPPHVPLTFDIIDTWTGRSIGGCRYHAVHPGGRNFQALPVNALEAEGRRLARFESMGHSPGGTQPKTGGVHPDFPLTLDLRRVP